MAKYVVESAAARQLTPAPFLEDGMQFTKLHGAGNDYLFVNGLSDERDWAALSVRLSDRHFGIGADGLIVVTPSDKADARMRMYNADGSEGEMCGNGIRCFAKFVLERQLVPEVGEALRVETGAGVLSIAPTWSNGRVVGAKVDMGPPILKATDVPVDSTKAGTSDYSALDGNLIALLGLKPTDLMFDAPVTISGTTFALTAVSMGNPHVTAFLDTPVHEVPLERLGPLVEHHAAFPKRINFHIANVISRSEMVSRTWERGSGQTLACGTGACAMVVAARLHGLVDNAATVRVPGGELRITWEGRGSVTLEGEAVEVFSGEWNE